MVEGASSHHNGGPWDLSPEDQLAVQLTARSMVQSKDRPVPPHIVMMLFVLEQQQQQQQQEQVWVTDLSVPPMPPSRRLHRLSQQKRRKRQLLPLSLHCRRLHRRHSPPSWPFSPDVFRRRLQLLPPLHQPLLHSSLPPSRPLPLPHPPRQRRRPNRPPCRPIVVPAAAVVGASPFYRFHVL